MSEKKRLGKGLGALIPEFEEGASEPGEIKEVPVMKIKPNPYQPRKDFNQEKLKELADSIKEHGVVQPIIVSPDTDDDSDSYLLVAGERRWRAAREAEIDSIPAVIKNVEKHTMVQVALIENLQREDLNPIEEALAYQRLINDFSLTQEELSKSIGKSRSTVANTIRLLSLPEEVQTALASGLISEGQARPLLSIKETGVQKEIAERIVNGKYNAREVEKMVSRAEETKKAGKKDSGFEEEKSKNALFCEDLREKLQKYLGTKVKIAEKKSSGTIEIEFFGQEDLDRVVSLITASKEIVR